MAITQKTIRVLIADDANQFRDSVKDLLEDEENIAVVGEAADGQDAVEMARKLKPEVVLMDVKLPRLDGFSATRLIKKEYPGTNVLMISGFDDEAYVKDAALAGANGYLSKKRPPAELIYAIKALSGEGFLIPQPVLDRLMPELGRLVAPGRETAAGPLTTDEMLVMGLLCRGDSAGEIAETLKCGVDTVRSHFNSIFRKLPVGGPKGPPGR
ncbi:MAG: response regulator transcription factor [Elusimicrobia bacterium]|nr:response regulator transcription factor [Elusimicrobiota bacterium]